MAYVYVDTEQIISEIDDDELISEIEHRGHKVLLDARSDEYELLQTIYEKRRVGQDYQVELDALIYSQLGRIL